MQYKWDTFVSNGCHWQAGRSVITHMINGTKTKGTQAWEPVDIKSESQLRNEELNHDEMVTRASMTPGPPPPRVLSCHVPALTR
jgi:hypothetical protein